MYNTTLRIATAFHRQTGVLCQPRDGEWATVGEVRLSSPQWKGHRPWDRTRELETHGVEGVVGRKEEGQDGV